MAGVPAAHGAFAPLLGKLTALLADECSRLKGLASMHAALKEYTKLEDPNEQVKAWISLVRELAYDTEDVFDRFIHHLGDGRDHGDGGFKDFFRKTVRRLKTLGARRGIAGEIDDLKGRIKQVKELKDCYKLSDVPSTSTGPAAAHLVGVDGPRDDLAKWMLEQGNNSSKHCKVLSIVGFGGLGKTTLANEVYRKIKGKFDCHAFVSVSQKPDIKKIIKDLISQVQSGEYGSTNDTSDWDERKCIAKLRELLQNKRYLIIIDGVWSIETWNTIKCAFPENSCSSRIIATTRIVDVAKSCCPSVVDRMYEMRSLNDLQSRKLFLSRIFGSGNQCPDMLKEVSDAILNKCGGLPLAIVTISSLLSYRLGTKEEWEKVKRAIGSGLEKNQSLEGMSRILSLSYNDLPLNLKTCLLYLSIFPEDYLIERKRLVRCWIAEGFISEECGLSQQEVAENYFYELINKNMVQPVDIEYDGKVPYCRVHDMMLEIIISKSVEDNFVTLVGGGQKSLTNHQGFIRRLSVQHIDRELASALEKEDLSHVRSLTVTSSVFMKHFPSLIKFEALRVLDFQGCKGLEEYDMSNVDRLFQLKYLSLKDTGISKLPSRILMLHDLETLDLRTPSMQELPSGIILLTKLQYLLTKAYCKVPNGIGNMRSLREAPRFDITKSSLDAVEELGNLSRLNKLGFAWTMEMGTRGMKRFYSPCYASLAAAISSLYLNVPKWISQELTSLSNVTIGLDKLRDEDLDTLGELPSLLDLHLHLATGPKKKLTVTGFPCLRRFGLLKRAMPKLEKLEQSFDVSVAKAYGFYLGIEHLPCLKVIQVMLCNKGATLSESKAAAASMRTAAGAHPNHPKILFLNRPVMLRKRARRKETIKMVLNCREVLINIGRCFVLQISFVHTVECFSNSHV
ncbi:hypothetical protein ZWY2020_006755 [Hordeum vulgare]|nr:hypothetical protein ZWY2020_006755 [Hordeum vulgare]